MNAALDRKTGASGTDNADSVGPRVLRRTMLALGLAVALAGCRKPVIFEGAEMQPSTGTVKMAAPAPLCGCANVTNTTSQPIDLRAVFNGRATGSTVLPPNESLQFRFDWAGPAPDDFYTLEGSTPAGQHVDLTKALRVQVSHWQNCSAASCSYGALGMNVSANANRQ